MLKAAIFDQDGILLDTEGYQYKGWVEVLRPLGIRLTKSEYLDYAGKTGGIIEGELRKRHGLKTEPGVLLKEKEKLLHKWFSEQKLRVFPFVRETVRFFKRRGLKVAVASGGGRREVLLKLQRAGLAELFPIVVTRDEVKRGKPYPDIYLEAAQRLHVKPGDCVAFEDTQYGVEAAVGAGMVCMAVPTPWSKRQDFSKAAAVCRNLREARRFVEGVEKRGENV